MIKLTSAVITKKIDQWWEKFSLFFWPKGRLTTPSQGNQPEHKEYRSNYQHPFE